MIVKNTRSILPLLVSLLLLSIGAWSQTDTLTPPLSPVVTAIDYKLGKSSVRISMLQYGNRRDIVCINLHDDEYTAVEAARLLLQQEGGLLIKIENEGNRNIRFQLSNKYYTIDPNRIFSKAGVIQTLKKNRLSSKGAIEQARKLGQRILSLIPSSARYVIALHNNRDGEPLSIRSYMAGGELSVNAQNVCHHPDQDADDFFLTNSHTVQQYVCKKGYNSVWQHAERVIQDGSLSVFYRNNKRVAYINCETEHGKTGQYLQMLQALLAIGAK